MLSRTDLPLRGTSPTKIAIDIVTGSVKTAADDKIVRDLDKHTEDGKNDTDTKTHADKNESDVQRQHDKDERDGNPQESLVPRAQAPDPKAYKDSSETPKSYSDNKDAQDEKTKGEADQSKGTVIDCVIEPAKDEADAKRQHDKDERDQESMAASAGAHLGSYNEAAVARVISAVRRLRGA